MISKQLGLLVVMNGDISRGKLQFMRAFLHNVGCDSVVTLRRYSPNALVGEALRTARAYAEEQGWEGSFSHVLVVPPADGFLFADVVRGIAHIRDTLSEDVTFWFPRLRGYSVDGFVGLVVGYTEYKDSTWLKAKELEKADEAS